MISANPDDKVKLSFTASVRSRDMLMQAPSRQMTAERGSLTASHFPGVSLFNFECETK